jgi:hypothetical protein
MMRTSSVAHKVGLSLRDRSNPTRQVRHWTTNSEADMGRGNLVATKKKFFGHHNAIGNIFYGSDGLEQMSRM